MLAPAMIETTTYPRPSAANTTAVIRTDMGALEDRLAAGSIRKLGSKEHLFLEGDPKTHVYKVEAGTVLIYKILPDSKRQVIDIAFPGDHIGLGSIGEHAFNAQATEPVRVRCLAVGTLHHLAALVESPRGLSPPGAPRTVREPLDSHGSRCSAVAMA